MDVVLVRADGALLVVEHVVVALARRLEPPRLACAQLVERELDVVLQLRRAAGPPGLVVDQLIGAVGQPVYTIDAATEQVWPDPESEVALEPDRRGFLGIEALVVALECRQPLGVELALI